MKTELNLGGKIVRVFKNNFTGRSLKDTLDISQDRQLVKKEIDGKSRIINDDDIIDLSKNKTDFFDDLPTLREGL